MKNGRLGAAETSKELAEWRRLQRKNWNKLGLPRRKEWPQYHRESSWQVRRSRLSRAPDHEGGESQDGRERGIRVRTWRGKGGLHGERRQIPGRAS